MQQQVKSRQRAEMKWIVCCTGGGGAANALHEKGQVVRQPWKAGEKFANTQITLLTLSSIRCMWT